RHPPFSPVGAEPQEPEHMHRLDEYEPCDRRNEVEFSASFRIGGSVTNEDKGPESSAPGAWGVLGFAVGAILWVRYAKAISWWDADHVATLEEVVITLFILFFPVFPLHEIGKQLAREVEKGHSTWATFWATTVSVSVAVLALLGVTSIDDLSALGS
ncbi:hypothetical protein, partial [Streptomyces sp. NPDC008125]|uniref:hypothetical protein n=1 Tax=Streptomyces sp. NPDC008125 TaxID=3364811 RepID=UPI0036E24788